MEPNCSNVPEPAGLAVGSGQGQDGWRSLVVRVKRKRSEPAGDSVIAVEGDGEAAHRKKRSAAGRSLEHTFADLSGPSADRPPARRLYLRRVQTIDAGGTGPSKRSAAEVDGDTVGTFRLHDLAAPATAATAAEVAATLPEMPPAGSASSGRWVTESKKRLRVEAEGDESIVVVDMEVRASSAATVIRRKEQPAAPAQPVAPVPRGVRVLDPASRALQAAIEAALTPTADATRCLSDCMVAIDQGASVNLQSQRHGLTALMAAAFHGDTRLVSRLLAKGADASLLTFSTSTAASGRRDESSHELKKALDFAEDPDFFGPHSAAKPSALREVVMLLQMAESNGPSPSRAGKSAGFEVPMEDDFVVDVYCVVEQAVEGEAPAHRVVSVPGLRFNVDETNGTIKDIDITDTVFAYDSDWSDLGDDEDPDSNDERFGGNDYPEEEDVDDGESVSDGSEALPVPHRAVMSNRPRGSDDDERWEDASSEGSAADGFGCENYDFEMDGSVCSSPNHMSEDDERPPAASQVRFHSGEASAVVLSDSLEVIEEAYRGPEWARMELLRRQAALMSKLPPLRSPVSNHAGSNTENDKIDFLRPVGGVDDSRALRSSGKILRPFTREDPFQPIQKRNGALKKLWEGSASGATRNDVGLVETREDDDIAVIRGTPAEDENEKIERLKHMNHRLGLVAFESNANEFDSSGIPKYGQDLSDDDVDLQLLRSAYSGDITWGGDGQVRLPKGCIKASELAKSCNFVAYDHEMDKSSSDQDA